jgi:hypothetical protein
MWNSKYHLSSDSPYFKRTTKSSTCQEEFVALTLFDALEPMNKWCVEVGAHNGVVGSNTYQLIMEKGWNSLQIEGNPILYRECVDAYSKVKDRVIVLNQQITSGFLDDANHFNGFPQRNHLDGILEQSRLPKNLDYLVIDVDSFDFEVWYNLKNYEPNVVLIEYNPFELDNEVINYDPSFKLYQYTGKRLGYGGASLGLLNKLAEQKGYDNLYYENNNAFFIRKEFGKPLLK